jgi:membrane protein DedA with SNARE-associated domain
MARIEEEVERVAQHDVVAEGRDLGGQHPLDRRLGGQRHEGRRTHVAVGRAQNARAGPRAGVAGGDGQGGHRGHARSDVVIAPLATFVHVAQNVGLPIVFLLIAIETMGIPVPGETALITAGIVASRGHLSIEAVIAVAAAAAILGDNVGFALGRRLGRRVLTAPGPLLHHRRRVVAVGEPFFDRHGPKAVFLGRWVTGLRITAAWMAGVTRMSWPTFLFWNALGGIAWATSIGLLAYFVGHSAEKFIHLAGIGGAVVVVLAGVALWFALRLRRRKAEALVEAEIEAQAEAEAGAR